MLITLSFLLLSIQALISPAVAAKNSTCYYPNGVANRGEACNPDAAVSVCCGPTFVCLSNGLCEVGPDTKRTFAYKYYRSGCTDASWNSSSCPQVCRGPHYNLEGGEGIQVCGNNEYCCAENYDCCSNTTNILTLGVANIVTTIPAINDAIENSTMQPGSSSTSTQASISGSNGNDRIDISIGVGVGVGVGGFLLVLLAVSLCLRHRRKNIAASNASSHEGNELAAREKSELESREIYNEISINPSTAEMGHATTDDMLRQELDGETKEYISSELQELEPQSRFELDGNEGNE
ncbi:uncharacterized protein K460DRAFT_350840 [Cucurbitaria berberidis CBS 394.84]|uniref:Mid2 domain-containing protein n=1 Tax=Cucurbitaria berberidis CBS 394.84 TaxID=1168544 RepID=A0A9P4LDA3_9PLEO|nr:uncharacterized protein K460DRAFT_350840 [Cucurbitaria berberidis CBS 394.84]KAF1850835.1 hypothetical protein K460DRAFT_350840 [Cucurbitaria berberidis CBS 394.84]